MPESLTRCPQGHYYDPTKQSACPWCSPSGIAVERPLAPPPAPSPVPPPLVDNSPKFVAPPPPPPMPAPPRVEPAPPVIPPPHTVPPSSTVSPVVGWLVCIEGPDRGADFRLHSDRNWVGRGPAMDVCVANDMTVSREKHAAVLFDPKRSTFWVTPGHATGDVYVNNEVVQGPVQMKADDVLEIGQTKLVLVPFCGEKHSWDKEPSGAAPVN